MTFVILSGVILLFLPVTYWGGCVAVLSSESDWIVSISSSVTTDFRAVDFSASRTFDAGVTKEWDGENRAASDVAEVATNAIFIINLSSSRFRLDASA